MSTIAFEDRVVAFVDVLGFSALTSSAALDPAVLKSLNGLVNLLESSIPSLDAGVSGKVPKELIPRHLYVSDCIILSAPLACTLSGWSHYDGLSIVVMRVIQLTHMLAMAGHLVRGGIAIGKAWHAESNILGPAYMEAYCLEQRKGAPRVVLSNAARDLWMRQRGGWARMCIDYQGEFMVNGLFDYYIPGTDPLRVEPTFQNYAATAQQVLASGASKGILEKWRWFQQYVAAELPYALTYSKHPPAEAQRFLEAEPPTAVR